MQTSKTDLINKNNKENPGAFLEQYKIYITLMDRVSDRRMKTNSFFITIHTLVLGVISLKGFNFTRYWWIIVILGLILSFVWWYSINSYKLLNTGKFKVIFEMEKLLPMNMYAYEWAILDYGKNRATYWPISHLERIIPVVFALVYVVFGICILVKR